MAGLGGIAAQTRLRGPRLRAGRSVVLFGWHIASGIWRAGHLTLAS